MASGKRKTGNLITRVIRLNKSKPDRKTIEEAANLIRSGELVAFPTETVYGLGANGLQASAIKKIFIAKNRPVDNPLILHLGYKKDIERYGRSVTQAAKKLIGKFWPGPLTVIVKRKKRIPDIVTNRLPTIALRMPDNKIALDLIRKAGVPIAAPSANVSGKPSPTSAQHVYKDMYGKIELILDGGKTDVGLESTIVDCSVDPPVILRPGRISRKEIEKVIGIVEIYLYNTISDPSQPKSPGLKYRHYAPDARLILVEGQPVAIKATIDAMIRQYRSQKKRIGILAFYPGHEYAVRKDEVVVNLGLQSNIAARKLFATLRYFDEKAADVILAECFPSQDHAITNRLRKAASEILIAQD